MSARLISRIKIAAIYCTHIGKKNSYVESKEKGSIIGLLLQDLRKNPKNLYVSLLCIGNAMMMRQDSLFRDWWNPAFEKLKESRTYRGICNDIEDPTVHGMLLLLLLFFVVVAVVAVGTINDNDVLFLFTDNHDMLFDKRMIWFFFGLSCLPIQ